LWPRGASSFPLELEKRQRQIVGTLQRGRLKQRRQHHQHTGDGHFVFNIAGVTGYKYAVQGSSDLVHWISVQTNTAPFTF